VYSSPTVFYLFSETRIKLIVVRTMLENIIERPPLKARPRDVA